MVGATKIFPGRALHQKTVHGKKELLFIDLNASWDNLIFTWMIIPCTGREHWGKVLVTISSNQLVLDSIHQQKARKLSSFLKGVSMEMVNHCGHASSLIVIV